MAGAELIVFSAIWLATAAQVTAAQASCWLAVTVVNMNAESMRVSDRFLTGKVMTRMMDGMVIPRSRSW